MWIQLLASPLAALKALESAVHQLEPYLVAMAQGNQKHCQNLQALTQFSFPIHRAAEKQNQNAHEQFYQSLAWR